MSETLDEQRQRLQTIKQQLFSAKEYNKPMFALVFWQLNQLESDLPPDDLMSQGLTLDFEDDSDELFAVFLGTFMELWQSSKSLDATCRFVAEALDMSANELIQGRALYRASRSRV